MVCSLWCAGLFASLLTLFTVPASAQDSVVDGMPVTRLYPLEEIGCTLSMLQLFHDEHGRIAVAQQDELYVLNDTTWHKVPGGQPTGQTFHRVLCAPDGTLYYAAFGSWGVLTKGPAGQRVPATLVPSEAPDWIHSCEFRDILHTESGLFIWGQDGVVHMDRRSGKHSYFPIRGVSWLFAHKGNIIVASFVDGMLTLDVENETCTPAGPDLAPIPPVIASAGDGQKALLLATTESTLLALRNGRLEQVRLGNWDRAPGPIVALVALPEGGFAASITGYGVVLLDNEGRMTRLLNSTDFKSATALESTEPGVLWAVTERGVLKVLHKLPYTAYGRDQGIHVNWPQVVQWQGRTLVSSGGKVFEQQASGHSPYARFRLLPGQPEYIGWGIAAVGESLLIGAGQGVYEMKAGSPASLILPGIIVARLAALDEDTCAVLATDTIAVIRRTNGKWVECAERVPGVGYPYVIHTGRRSAWIELGMDRVARLSFDGEKLRVRLLANFDWKEKSWVNVSLLGDTAILCAASRMPMFLDERTLQPVEAAELRALVNDTPYAIQRFCSDLSGTLWVSHTKGIFPARFQNGRYKAEYHELSGINESVAHVRCLANGELWASTDKRLYQLETSGPKGLASKISPMLVGVTDSRTGQRLALPDAKSGDLGTLRHAQNSLQLDLFAGTYAWVRPITYEYRLNSARWERINAESTLFLADLSAHDYTMQVRAVDTLGSVGMVSTFTLSVAPPWYRRWYAYATIPLVAIALGYLALRLAAYHQRRRLAQLEQLVSSRTAELRNTMDCLREETSAKATLEERNRLAGEIHDSLEQGFAGLALQLEATARLASCAAPVRAGLASAINLVHYCRDELRNAVRGLHAPVLKTESLETALKRTASQLSPLANFARVSVEGSPRRLTPANEHHLLRIAQEALGNVTKHAGATKVDIHLCYSDEAVTLSIKDDGCGFDPTKVQASDSAHYGLPSFAHRASKIGGIAHIESSPGHGTSVRITVPLQAPPPPNS